MRISDWSSDVCSSDLALDGRGLVEVVVEDGGRGMAPDVLDHAFDSFFTTKPQGMGLGLAISRSMVEAHGGQLWATSQEGVGTTVHFTLPIAGEASTDTTENGGVISGLAGGRRNTLGPEGGGSEEVWVGEVGARTGS